MAKTAKKTANNNELLRALPSVDALLKTETARVILADVGTEKLTVLARHANDDLRTELIRELDQSDSGRDGFSREQLLQRSENKLASLHKAQKNSGVRRVINATGVVLHTNLGRAPLSDAAREAMLQAAGYCSLEYDTLTGDRGRRGARAENLLIDVTGAEAALIVNNCAAAALLVLSTFAQGGETIVSRGELVEIGGDFRVTDVMAQSGTRMVEVGTTNRTRLSDYEKAINDNTRAIMRVHTSNYRIVGFTKTPSLSELVELARRHALLLYEDAGSGALIDLSDHGIDGEPVIRQSIEEGADIVTFSGDKLLGGPQAGLVVGRAQYIEHMRKNPLYRALRADKLRLAALEATLESHVRGELVSSLAMIAASAEEIEIRSRTLSERVTERIGDALSLEVVHAESAVGGGAAPMSPLPTFAIAIDHSRLSADEVAARLRRGTPAVIARIQGGRVLLDLRTVAESEEKQVESALINLAEIR